MLLLGVVILAIIVGLVLLGIAFVAGLTQIVRNIVESRQASDTTPRVGFLRLFAVLVLAGAIAVMLASARHPAPLPGGAGDGTVDIGSPALRPFQAMYAVPRGKYGFTPLPKHARVKIETLTGADAVAAGYDALMHIYPGLDKTKIVERTISFQRIGGKYQWTGEQEMWTGPRPYQLPDDSTTNEDIGISYATRPGSGAGLINTLQIMYAGNDPRLSGKENLTLKDVKPVLKEWGAYQQGAYED